MRRTLYRLKILLSKDIQWPTAIIRWTKVNFSIWLSSSISSYDRSERYMIVWRVFIPFSAFTSCECVDSQNKSKKWDKWVSYGLIGIPKYFKTHVRSIDTSDLDTRFGHIWPFIALLRDTWGQLILLVCCW